MATTTRARASTAQASCWTPLATSCSARPSRPNEMRTVLYGMMVSLDGYIADAEGGLDWILIDEELHAFANQQQATSGALLYGRRLWETMAEYWPLTETLPDVTPVEAEYGRI